MRILMINPNTSSAMTELLATRMRDIVEPHGTIVPATGRFGARYIASRAAVAIAGHAALDALAEHGANCDIVLLACFGDPGLAALREVSPVPVVGMAEASIHEACSRGERFAIVTAGAAWAPMLNELIIALGLADRLAGIRTIAASGGDIACDPEKALGQLTAACFACAIEDGADSVILGGAGLAGLAGRIQAAVPVPLICSVEAGTRAVLAMHDHSVRPQAPAPTASINLAPALERLLARASSNIFST